MCPACRSTQGFTTSSLPNHMSWVMSSMVPVPCALNLTCNIHCRVCESPPQLLSNVPSARHPCLSQNSLRNTHKNNSKSRTQPGQLSIEFGQAMEGSQGMRTKLYHGGFILTYTLFYLDTQDSVHWSSSSEKASSIIQDHPLSGLQYSTQIWYLFTPPVSLDHPRMSFLLLQYKIWSFVNWKLSEFSKFSLVICLTQWQGKLGNFPAQLKVDTSMVPAIHRNKNLRPRIVQNATKWSRGSRTCGYCDYLWKEPGLQIFQMGPRFKVRRSET